MNDAEKLEQIRSIVDQVHTLDITPMRAIDTINMLLLGIEYNEEKTP